MTGQLRVLAIGDSLTAGYGVPPEQGFVHQYVRMLQSSRGLTVDAENTGKSGATSEDIWNAVRTDPQVRSAAEKASVVTLTAGGNDLIQAAKRFYFDNDTKYLVSALKGFQRNVSHILEEIERIKAGRNPYIVFVIGLYNPLPVFEEAVFWVNKFNEHLRAFQSDRVIVVDIYGDFLGREDDLLGDDRFHPNAEGYRIIAQRVHEAGRGLIGGLAQA